MYTAILRLSGAHKYTQATGGPQKHVTTLKAPGAYKKLLSEKTDVTNRNVAQKRVTPPGVYTAILKLLGIVYKIAYQKHVTPPGGVTERE